MTKIVDQHQKTDGELIQELKAGESDITLLYERYSSLVFGSCLKYFKNRADADDAVSEIFSLVSKKLVDHEVTHFKSWLYTVTRNYCVEVLRKKNRLRDKVSTAESMYSESIFHPDDVQDEELLRKLGDCIAALPDFQRKTYMQNGRRNLKNCLESKS